MNIDRYNTRIRQAVSDKYVECNKKKREITQQIMTARRKLIAYMDGDETLTYREYIDLKSSIDNLYREDDKLDIQIAVWDEARELCLNIEDEMRDAKECNRV